MTTKHTPEEQFHTCPKCGEEKLSCKCPKPKPDPTKHTPGPWNRGYGNFIYRGEKLDPAGNQRLIAICEPTTKTADDWQETFSNARLIAAAPDLLEALRATTEYLDNMIADYIDSYTGNGSPDLSIEIDAVSKAVSAIAKATGE